MSSRGGLPAIGNGGGGEWPGKAMAIVRYPDLKQMIAV